MSTVQEILSAMDKLTPDELRVVKIGLESRLDDEDEPALQGALEEVRAMIPQWISGSKSQHRP